MTRAVCLLTTDGFGHGMCVCSVDMFSAHYTGWHRVTLCSLERLLNLNWCRERVELIPSADCYQLVALSINLALTCACITTILERDRILFWPDSRGHYDSGVLTQLAQSALGQGNN